MLLLLFVCYFATHELLRKDIVQTDVFGQCYLKFTPQIKKASAIYWLYSDPTQRLDKPNV
jgi:hypothetical protein